LIAYGNDFTTPVKDGFLEGETLTWKVFSFQTGKVHDIEVSYNYELPQWQGTFQTGGISAVTGIYGIITIPNFMSEIGICEGTLLNLNVQTFGGTGDYTYVWTSQPEGFYSSSSSVIVQPIVSTTYHVMVSDGLFSNQHSVMINVAPIPSAHAGNDFTIAVKDAFSGIPLSGSAQGHNGVEWFTSGDGTFDDEQLLSATYFPGTIDIEAKSITLTLYAKSFAGCQLWGVDSVNITLRNSFTIPVKPGWQGISSPVVPTGGSFSDIMGTLGNDFIIGYNFWGMFWPQYEVNTTGSWNETDAYILKMETFGEISIEGDEPGSQAMLLDPSWNLIPVLCETMAPVEDIFATHVGLVLVKEIGGNGIYWPMFNVNTLGYLQAGTGYFAYTQFGGEIVYEGLCSSEGFKSSSANITSPWNEIAQTPNTHSIAITQQALEGLLYGDIIGAFTPDGLCAGLVMVGDIAAAISINGNDVQTIEQDGFVAGEKISFKLYRPATGETFDLKAEYLEGLESSGKFTSNGISAISTFILSATGESKPTATNLNIFPNPTTGTINISGLSHRAEVVVKNAMGALVIATQVETDGKLNLSSLPKGVYFIQISTPQVQHTEKLIIH